MAAEQIDKLVVNPAVMNYRNQGVAAALRWTIITAISFMDGMARVFIPALSQRPTDSGQADERDHNRSTRSSLDRLFYLPLIVSEHK